VRLFLLGFHVLSTLPDKVVESFVQRLKTLRNTHSDALHEWLVEQAESSVADGRSATWIDSLAALASAAQRLRDITARRRSNP
jgi:hypothetical protein